MSELLVIQQMKKIETRYKYHFRDEEKVSILLQCMHSPRIRNKLTDIFEELTNIADSTKNEKLKFYIETCIYFEKEKIRKTVGEFTCCFDSPTVFLLYRKMHD